MCQKVEIKNKDKASGLSNQYKKTQKSLITFFFLFLSSSIRTFAQDTASTGDPFNDPMFPAYLIGGLVLVTVILTLTVTILLLRVLKMFTQKAGEEKAQRLGIAYKPTPSWWEKFWSQANDLVPLENEKDIELDHDYDGIKELDNHLPPWWKGLFYACIVFAVIYMVLYHFTDSFPLPEQEYQNELALADENARILRASRPPELIDENTLTFSNDAEIIGRGKIVFTGSNCASCHRADGGGNSIGPNLTDEYWLHGGEIKNVFTTINKGVIEKAMPAWGKVMSQKDVRDVAFYVMSLQGTKPDNAKAPQGELFKPVQPKSDTVRVDSVTMAIKK